MECGTICRTVEARSLNLANSMFRLASKLVRRKIDLHQVDPVGDFD